MLWEDKSYNELFVKACFRILRLVGLIHILPFLIVHFGALMAPATLCPGRPIFSPTMQD